MADILRLVISIVVFRCVLFVLLNSLQHLDLIDSSFEKDTAALKSYHRASFLKDVCLNKPRLEQTNVRKGPVFRISCYQQTTFLSQLRAHSCTLTYIGVHNTITFGKTMVITLQAHCLCIITITSHWRHGVSWQFDCFGFFVVFCFVLFCFCLFCLFVCFSFV